MPKETATERRTREATEARIALEKWEAEKPMRLLRALARMPQNDPEMRGRVFFKHDQLMYLFYSIQSEEICGYVNELSVHMMSYIENVVVDYEVKRQKEVRMLALRAELLSKMTDEEREALGL